MNRFGLLLTDLHAERVAGGTDRKVAVSQPSHEVKRLARRLLQGELHGVAGHGLFHDGAHVVGSAEEAVCRHQPAQRLMGPLEVVAVDEEREPFLAVGKVTEDRP